jgi:hypothetical protein
VINGRTYELQLVKGTNEYVLQQVPEPGSLALLAVSLVAASALRSRSRTS